MVRYRWAFVAGIATWTLLLVLLVVQLRNDGANFSFWSNAFVVVVLTAALLRDGHFRWSARQ